MSDRFTYAVLAPRRLLDLIRAVWSLPRSQPILVITPPTKGKHRG